MSIRDMSNWPDHMVPAWVRRCREMARDTKRRYWENNTPQINTDHHVWEVVGDRFKVYISTGLKTTAEARARRLGLEGVGIARAVSRDTIKFTGVTIDGDE